MPARCDRARAERIARWVMMTSRKSLTMLCGALLCAAQLAVLVSGAVEADEVTALPGWTGPLPSRHYSGYVDVSADPARHHTWALFALLSRRSRGSGPSECATGTLAERWARLLVDGWHVARNRCVLYAAVSNYNLLVLNTNPDGRAFSG